MKKLMITADDYGMSRAVNDAIDAGIAAGLITSTNVMTNMPFYTEAVKLEDNPNISVGLHWVVLPREEIPTLVVENDFFYPYAEFHSRLRKKQISSKKTGCAAQRPQKRHRLSRRSDCVSEPIRHPKARICVPNIQ